MKPPPSDDEEIAPGLKDSDFDGVRLVVHAKAPRTQWNDWALQMNGSRQSLCPAMDTDDDPSQIVGHCLQLTNEEGWPYMGRSLINEVTCPDCKVLQVKQALDKY